MWRFLIKQVVLLGLPLIIGKIRGKNKTVAQIVDIIVTTILNERPDLLGTPGLEQEARRRVLAMGLSPKKERAALGHLRRTHGR